jgi:DUF971 family protein
MTKIAADPEHIAISKSKGIEIDWKDGHHSSFQNEYLRDWCPCASCTGSHGTEPRQKTTQAPPNPFQIYKPKLKMNSIEAVGSYAVRISWNDGHDTGIYSFDHLRSVCPCPQCQASKTTG